MELHLRDIVLFLIALIQAIGVKAAFQVADSLREIRADLSSLNAEVKTTRALHEKLDKANDEYHKQCIDRLTHIEHLHEKAE